MKNLPVLESSLTEIETIHHKKTTILIVDDAPLGRKVLQSLLISEGYDLAFAADGPEALHKAGLYAPDLILLDIMMPGMDGYEVCERLRADPILGEVPIIMVTTLDDADSRLRGIEAGADDFVSKPFNRAELRARVRTITRLNRYRRLHTERTKFERVFELSPDGILIIDQLGVIHLANSAIRQMLDVEDQEDIINRAFQEFIAFEQLSYCLNRLKNIFTNPTQTDKLETVLVGLDGKRFPVEIVGGYFEWNNKPATQIMVRNITERVKSKKQIEEQIQMLHALFTSAQKLAQSLDPQELAEDIVRACVDFLGAQIAWLGRADKDGSVYSLKYYSNQVRYLDHIQFRWDETPSGQGNTGIAIREGFPVISNDIAYNPDFLSWRQTALSHGIRTAASYPLISQDKAFGVLNLYSNQPDFFLSERAELFQAYAHQVAAALENARLFTDTERHLQHLHALRKVEKAIATSLELRLILDILLDQVMTQLKIDAANLLLFKPYVNTLEYAAERGFRLGYRRAPSLTISEGLAGMVLLERRTLLFPNLAEKKRSLIRPQLLTTERFSSYVGVPLIAKGEIKGVLEIFTREPITADSQWLELLQTMAGQAAIAIDNATLFENLQRSNIELAQAYDATLEGWVRALDLRDKETEGHTQRVTEMTIRLARKMGMDQEELVHVRRGALLHDIGKMGIPDYILHKPGPLSEAEWEIMRRHPIYAYDMLYPISFLRPALDIPYSHHEKWDGSGYPRQLKGQDIPFAARLFAVIDVWDALRSDRPYRKAWPKEKVLDYIKGESGKHFDPKVVMALDDLISNAIE